MLVPFSRLYGSSPGLGVNVLSVASQASTQRRMASGVVVYQSAPGEFGVLRPASVRAVWMRRSKRSAFEVLMTSPTMGYSPIAVSAPCPMIRSSTDVPFVHPILHRQTTSLRSSARSRWLL